MDGQTALAYIRVSVVGNRAARGRFESPDLQRASIDACAHQHGLTVTDEIQDLNRSGGTLTRPGLQKALQAVKHGEADGIMVARSDRASRRALDGLGLIDELARMGSWIIAADGSIDSTTRTGRMATTMNLAMAQSEYERFKEQTAEIHRRAILEKGRHMGPAPFGYQRGPDGRLAIHPEESAVVRVIFEHRADQMGWATLARLLQDQGVRRRDGRVLSALQLRRMVARRVYLGEASHGELCKPDAHPAILEEPLWQAANRAFPAVRSAPSSERRVAESLLRGLLRCSGCRFVLKRQPQPSGKVRWLCRSLAAEKTSSHVCASPARIRQAQSADVEEAVVEAFFDLAAEQGVARSGEEVDVAVLERAVADAEAMLDELSSLDVRRELGAARWAAMVADARKAADEAERELATGRLKARRSVTTDERTLRQAWALMDPGEKATALRSIVQAVMVDPGDAPAVERVHVLPVWVDVDLPRRGSTFDVRPWQPD